MHVGPLERVEARDPLQEPAAVAEEPLSERRSRRAVRSGEDPVDELAVVESHELLRHDTVAREPDRPLEHGGGRPHGVVPVDLAEHHGPRRHEHLGCGSTLLADAERPAVRPDAEARKEPFLVEMPTVRHSRVEAVAGEVVHLVDVDRPRQKRGEKQSRRIVRLTPDEPAHAVHRDVPLPREHVRQFPLRDEAVNEGLVGREALEPHVLDRMAESPVADVMDEGRDDEGLRVLGAHPVAEGSLVAEPPEKLQGQPEDAERVLEPRVHRAGVDERHEPELADPREPSHRRGVDDRPHPPRQRHGKVGRDADRVGSGPQHRDFGKGVVDRHVVEPGGRRWGPVTPATGPRANAASRSRARRNCSG